MDTINTIWGFFLTTNGWFLGLWSGWFGFFKGILPWYLGLHDLSAQIFIALIYLGSGFFVIAKTGRLEWPNLSQNKIMAWIQNALYNLYVAATFPAITIIAFMIAIPLYPFLIFYGLWIMAWFGVGIVALLYCMFIWPFTLFFH